MQLFKTKDSRDLSDMKSVFLDRDGVINELIYYREHGIIDSPFTVEQFRLLPGVGVAINNFHKMDYVVILVSNQPGIAKGNFSEETFEEIRKKMKEELAKEGAFLDGEYYCFHHPEAKIARYKVNCLCRKPQPGLLLQAAKYMDIDLSQLWMIGDGLTHVKAGKEAGCRTVLLGKAKCELCRMMDEEMARPDIIASNLEEATENIEAGVQDNLEQTMKKELMEILCCPVCKGSLELHVEKENEREIVSGFLYCPRCNEHYPIVETIPNLLVPDRGE